MARIIGNLTPEDDYTHALGPELNFNESMYFNFFDPERSLGGFVRLGNRANEGRAEMTVTLYLPDGRVLFGFERASIQNNDAFNAGGLRFEVLEPSQRLRTAYAGSLLELREPRQLWDPRKAFTQNPRLRVSLDLLHDAVGPMYGNAHDAHEEDHAPEAQFARAHYEQHMAVCGELWIGDARVEIDGFGLRDHSWGPRYWQAVKRYEWLTMNFGAELGAMVSVIQREADDEPRRAGVIVRGEELEPLAWADVSAEYEEGELFHRRVHARLRTQSGQELEVSGEVRSFVPLRNRRGGVTTYIGEGMTEWRLDGQRGYGLSEFLRTLD